MPRCVPTLAMIAVLATTIGASADAEHGDTSRPIADGTYHCKAGSSRMMLTLGDITIAGKSYTFVTPTGERTSGTYATGPDRYTWSGDISAIRNDQIVDSGRNQDADNSDVAADECELQLNLLSSRSRGDDSRRRACRGKR